MIQINLMTLLIIKMKLMYIRRPNLSAVIFIVHYIDDIIFIGNDVGILINECMAIKELHHEGFGRRNLCKYLKR